MWSFAGVIWWLLAAGCAIVCTSLVAGLGAVLKLRKPERHARCNAWGNIGVTLMAALLPWGLVRMDVVSEWPVPGVVLCGLCWAFALLLMYSRALDWNIW